MNEVQEIVYIETKQQCQDKIDSDHRVCSHCGGEREPIETVDNAGRPTYWAGCMACQRFDNGVTPIVYEIAKMLVDERNYIAYSHMDSPSDRDEAYKKYYRESQIGGATYIVRDVLLLHDKLTKKQ